MKTALSKQKQNIMQQQVAAGREFKVRVFLPWTFEIKSTFKQINTAN